MMYDRMSKEHIKIGLMYTIIFDIENFHFTELPFVWIKGLRIQSYREKI